MIKAAIAKVRAYEALLRDAIHADDETEVKHLQTMIDEWRKLLEDLLKD